MKTYSQTASKEQTSVYLSMSLLVCPFTCPPHKTEKPQDSAFKSCGFFG